MKAIYKLFATTASLALLSCFSQAALVTNEFITAGGNFTTATNWSLGSVPVIGTDVGVLNSITATNTSTRPFDNKQLVLNGTSLITAPATPMTGTNFNIVLNDGSQIYANSGGSMSYGTLTLNNASMFNVFRDEAFTNCTITLNGTSTGMVQRTTTLTQGTVINLNDSSVFRQVRNVSTDVPVIDGTSYFNFTSTNAVLHMFLAQVDLSTNFNQMIVDGKIRAHGLTVSTNNFKVTYIAGIDPLTDGMFVQLIPEPATVGLMGLSGVVIFFLRRQIKKQDSEQ